MTDRIQLRRAKGWRLPEGAVKVDRSTPWGNPFTVEGYKDAGWSVQGEVGLAHARKVCAEAYRAWLLGEPHWGHGCRLPIPPDITQLRGKDLACWCPPRRPYEPIRCHADVLLELANA